VVATRDAAGLANIYLNGVLSGTADQTSGTPVAGTTNVQIGNNSSLVNTFDGYIDDVRIYNRVLTVAEINRIYNLGK
jgi:hypothetical protein